MTWLVLGLILLLGMHSSRIVADPWRSRGIEQWGLNGWKALYTVVSLLGLALVIWGFAQTRLHPVPIWQPALAFKHLNSLFTLAAFVLIVAAYVPRNHFKAWLHHPMVLGVLLWALGHLLATGLLSHLVLFGAFVLWAVLNLLAAYRRDRTEATVYPDGSLTGSVLTLVIGLVLWAAFAFWAHGAWIGVAPF